MTASRFQTLPILASARRHERGGEKFKKKKKKKKTVGKGQTLNPKTLTTFSPGSACFGFGATCGMFALRCSAAALRLRRTVGSFGLFSSYPDSCSHSLPSPPPETRVLDPKNNGKCGVINKSIAIKKWNVRLFYSGMKSAKELRLETGKESCRVWNVSEKCVAFLAVLFYSIKHVCLVSFAWGF